MIVSSGSEKVNIPFYFSLETMDDEENTNSFIDEDVLSSNEDEDEEEQTLLIPEKVDDESDIDDEDDDEEDELEVITEEDCDFTLIEEVIENNIRFTSPYFTKYELAKILSVRSVQLEKGAQTTTTLADYPDLTFPAESMEIAKKELELKKIPIIIRRPLPNGEKITISANSLLIPINFSYIKT